MVGDSYAMRVAAEILQHVFGPTEGAFRVDHPVFSEEQPQPGREGFGLSERSQSSRQVQSAILEGLLETSDDLAANRLELRQTYARWRRRSRRKYCP